MSIRGFLRLASIVVAAAVFASGNAFSQVKPGDAIGKDNAAKVKDLLSPGNYILVQNGMKMNIVPVTHLDWPPPYKAATEKYSPQVGLTPDGTLKNYVAGQPFPLVDPNDPQVAIKVMWNFSFRPLYSDDADLRFPQVASYSPQSKGEPLSYFSVGHFAFYNNVGRIEVNPVPTDPDAAASGVRYRFGFYPFLEPSSLRGYGMLRFRHISPTQDDNTWVFNPQTRRLRRQSPEILSDAIGGLPGFSGGGGAGKGGGMSGAGGTAYVNTIDPDSYFGFAAKIEDFTYKFLGERTMLACVHARYSPERPCAEDGGRSICPEDWELRRLYIVEADQKPGKSFSIPKRILYIDSEGWFITASDQYDRDGKMWKTIAAYNTFRDRPIPDAQVAIYPYKRIFQLGLVDYDLQSGASTVVYMPGKDAPEKECWYIDMGVVDSSFFTPNALQSAGH